MVANRRKISMIRAAADLSQQIADGWPMKPADVAPELRPAVGSKGTFADELVEGGGFVFKGQRYKR